MLDDDFDPFAGGEISRTAPTTEPQREIWVAAEIGGDEASLAFNESVSLELHGPIDTSLFAKAWAELLQRHEALRCTLARDGLTLCVETAARGGIEYDDLSELREAQRRARIDAARHESVTTPFDLVHGPLVRAQLYRLGPDRSEFIMTAHHIVCDGYSAGVLLTDLATIYSALVAGKPFSLPAAPQFSDYASSLHDTAHGQEAIEAERYWLSRLGDAPPVLDLPTDVVRPAQRRYDAAREDFRLDAELLNALRATGRSVGASLVATLFAAFNALIYRISGQVDFVVGMPAAGQTDAGFEGLVGHCVNTLPLHARVDPEAPFSEQVRAAKTEILDGLDHQCLSFGGLLQKLELARDPSRIPLIPILFNIDPPMQLAGFGRATATLRVNPRAFDAFELYVNGTETETGLVLETTFNAHLFRRETVVAWLEGFETLLRAVASDPSVKLGQLPTVPETTRHTLLVEWNDTAAELPAEPTVTAAFESAARRFAPAIAVRDGLTSLTYTELDRRANHLAHKLQAVGVGPETLVGVCIDRSVHMLVALLAVWKAGAAYAPLDPDYPPKRLSFIAKDAGIRVLLTERTLESVLADALLERICVEEQLDGRPDAPTRRDEPSRLAYVLHTSGSTGQPKGVQVEHGSLMNFLSSMARAPGLTKRDVLVAVTTLSFDIAGLELFLPLFVGGQTVIVSREVAMDGVRLAKTLDSTAATALQATPATWRLLVEAGWRGPPGFKALCGGEALRPELAAQLLRRAGELWNLYGPTETTIWSSVARIESADAPIPIGKPIANTQFYIVDDHGEPTLPGVRGELLIGGSGVARGYLGRPELDAERFVANRFSDDGGRLYRTGDVARWGPDGHVYFERRNDAQVKVRGFRIELGEIQAALESHSDVQQAVVVVHEFAADDTRLIAYVVTAAGATFEPAGVRSHVALVVPPYMLPQHLIELDSVPLTPNGKLDRRALPMPDSASNESEGYVAPTTPVQERLAGLWSDLLRIGRVGIRDSFFDLGGHSMLAARMVSRTLDELGVEVSLRTVFQAQTIESLSAHIEAAELVRNANRPTEQILEEQEF